MMDDVESIEELRKSFAYGSRSNLNIKFVKDLSDAEFGQFLEELFDAVGHTIDDGQAGRVIDVAYRWQVQGYGGHLGDPADFAHRYENTPVATLAKPLSEATVALITSSGHFVAGHDPQPFGVEDMTQAEAEARIGDFLKTEPTLSSIPFDTSVEHLRVRHGGYPIQGAVADPGVALPLEHLRALEADGTIGRLLPSAYSFVGATSQVRLKKQYGPQWAERLHDEGADAVLLVPV